MAHGPERHRTTRIGWLRAAVLGANDGIVSTASLVLGVSAATTDRRGLLVAGAAGLVAGAMSMAAGEYVSVSSQADTERADLARERKELASDPAGEREELVGIYLGRGLDRRLAEEVVDVLMAGDALSAHARDELGLSLVFGARPVQAAVTSAVSFAAGAALPLVIVMLAADRTLILSVAAGSLVALGGLGALAAKTGGARTLPATWRVVTWGALAMATTSLLGRLFGAIV